MASSYTSYIDAQVIEADATLVDLRARSISVVSSSAGLVTLLSGLIALTSTRRGSVHLSRGWFAAALLFYVLAALLALVVNIPRLIQRPSMRALRELPAKRWSDDEAYASREIAETQLGTLESLRSANDLYAKVLLWAVVLEILGVLATGLMAWSIARHL